MSAGPRPTDASSPWLQTAHCLPIEELLSQLDTNAEQGLTEEHVSQRRERHGYNELAQAPPVPLWKKLLRQFSDLVIWILIVAAIISGALHEWLDAGAILAIVLLNGVIGFFQEERAERALAALQKMSAPMAKALRGGALVSIPARDLVPGDVIELEAGDNIPADARLWRSFELRLQEAALTGESTPVEKNFEARLERDTDLADRVTMVYMGTIVSAGKGRAVVAATGMSTELGRIAGMLEEEEREPTPLQRRLSELGRILIVICLAIVTVMFVLQLMRTSTQSEKFWTRFAEALLSSVTLAVAAVPEGLPAVVTIALALGLQRMVKRNALIRKLPSVETLGCVTVICSDKTGTLTKNEMTVRQIYTGGHCYSVEGIGYAPEGSFHKQDSDEAVDAKANPDLRQTLLIGARCNNAQVQRDESAGDAWKVLGDPTEGALIVAAMKAGLSSEKPQNSIIYEIPFDSQRKAMSIALKDDGNTVLFTKGAPEVILERCRYELQDGEAKPLDAKRRSAILETNARMAKQALRVLALAMRENPPERSQNENQSDPETDLVFAGLAGMIDPPRPEARVAVSKCREAGIRPLMITGDHPSTALAIATDLGLVESGQRAVSGAELEQWDDQKLSAEAESIAVYARASAEHKLRIVRAWKSRGQVVAMTGDGVNDAPAVKFADIGIAMGITGTDVTKEASDMVLMDDNFASIVSAIEEGRGIFDNIQKVLKYLLSCNFGEILLMLIATLVGWPIPLKPIQLLWINLVTDGLPALALSLEPPEPGIMRRAPRSPRESILSLGIGLSVVYQGLLVAAVALTAFALTYDRNLHNEAYARSVAFCVIVFDELFRAFAARSNNYTLWELKLRTNPLLMLAVFFSALLQVGIASFAFTRDVFEIHLHDWKDWLFILGLSLIPVSIIEITKLIRLHVLKKAGG